MTYTITTNCALCGMTEIVACEGVPRRYCRRCGAPLSRPPASPILRAVLFLGLGAMAGIAHGQNIVAATKSGGPVTLKPATAAVTFVASNANNVDGAVKSTALSMAQAQTVSTVLRAVPIPIIGPFAGPLIGSVMKRFSTPKPVTGFSIAFVSGLSATTAIQAGQASFTIPAESLQGATPTLLRLKISEKDSTRIVRSLQLSVKPTGPTVTPDAKNAQVLGVEQNLVPTFKDERDGAVILTSEAPLEAGEYAIALVPSAQQAMVPIGIVWDFRVTGEHIAVAIGITLPPAAPVPVPPPASEPQTISAGQTSAQVVASFGQPQRIVKLGAKEIYYYSDIRVTFVNGKVTEVE
jgi:hypothetical protein